ncbi:MULTISPECIES: ROK family transcriptional regulator [Vibrio]|uniref:XylR family transcriptional regulator n=3 Tax=Vibrio TaxID=662 RepID=A0A1C3IQK1_VIBSP|nr:MULTISPECIES: ROK family transcriptional regulator [Vibrio]MBO7914412.1 ROK family transcriptional regulator [Vibrio sp. G41H]MBT9240050.1 ROK family transcriptional regulator [Vibrio splendidus]MCF7493355.1 ROK family transcriptional regulator [Vibrio sp. G-C-1]MCT4349310.1 ROK family transcriptional regulator [Vibrio sp. NC2]MCW4440367.1 ROK family transcriptional regulator [Vibrio splendidus]
MNKPMRSGLGVSLDDVQNHNKRVILNALHNSGSCSRKEISQLVGLDQATVTRAIKPLIEQGLIVETGVRKAARGRSSIYLGFNTQHLRIVSVRIQRTNFSIDTYDLNGVSLTNVVKPINTDNSPEELIEYLTKQVSDVLKEQECDILGVAVAMPGPFLEQDNKIMLMTDAKNWQDIDFISHMRKQFPDYPIYAGHDAKLAALAVWRQLQSTYEASVLLYVSLGQGVGSGLVIEGQVYHGSLGTAGEIGHTSINFQGPQCKCGNLGCLELYTSTTALVERYKQEASLVSADFEMVVNAFHDRESTAINAVDYLAKCLAYGLVNNINQLNPDLVVIGDEMTQLGADFLSRVKEYTFRLLLPDLASNIELVLDESDEDLVHKGNYHNVMSNELLLPLAHLGIKASKSC